MQASLGFFPPFPASCAFRSTMATPRHSSLTDPTVQISRSGFVTRTHHLAQSTRPESRQIVRRVTGTSEPSSESRRWFPRPTRPHGHPLPSSGYRGRSFQKPCGSPPSQVLLGHKTAHPSVHGHLRSPLATVLPLLRAEMGSSPGFMGNPFGNMP